MNTKNIIINNYASALTALVSNFAGTASTLNDNVDENMAIIKTLNVILESVRSQTVLVQSALDGYPDK